MSNDFVQFYSAGEILNRHQPARIYDDRYLVQLENQALPEMGTKEVLLFGYPPIVAQLFRPFALLPYDWAFGVWLAFSLGVYGSGVWLLFRDSTCAGYRRTACLLSLSTPAFLFESWMGGQLSVITFFAVVLFVCCFEHRWLALAGLALGFASYKPSLIALPAAMMILGGCWRMLAGLAASTALLSLGSVATAGINGYWLWILHLRKFSTLATANDSIIPRSKYVDLNSFFAIILGGNSVARVVTLATISMTSAVLGWAWWQTRHRQTIEIQRYMWAATLTWMLIVNIYVPIYDTILLVPAAALVTRALAGRSARHQAELQAWLAVLWLVPWITQPSAHLLRLQILTVALAGFGFWALRLAQQEQWSPENQITAAGRNS